MRVFCRVKPQDQEDQSTMHVADEDKQDPLSVSIFDR